MKLHCQQVTRVRVIRWGSKPSRKKKSAIQPTDQCCDVVTVQLVLLREPIVDAAQSSTAGYSVGKHVGLLLRNLYLEAGLLRKVTALFMFPSAHPLSMVCTL